MADFLKISNETLSRSGETEYTESLLASLTRLAGFGASALFAIDPLTACFFNAPLVSIGSKVKAAENIWSELGGVKADWISIGRYEFAAIGKNTLEMIHSVASSFDFKEIKAAALVRLGSASNRRLIIFISHEFGIEWVKTFLKCRGCDIAMLAESLLNSSLKFSAVKNNETELMELSDIKRRLADEGEKFEKMLESIGEGVIAVDCEMKVVFINRMAEQLCGTLSENAMGKPIGKVFTLVDAESHEPRAIPVEKTLKTLEIVGLEHNSVLLSGTDEKYLSASSAPFFDRANKLKGAIIVFRDITGRKKMEEELLKVSKLESLGTLAGGIAHDFNNLLTGITGNITYARFMIPPESKAIDALNAAEAIAFKAKDLTAQFRTFSKGGVPVKKTVYIADIIKSTVEFSLRGTMLMPVFDIENCLWPCEIDEGQINQVIAGLTLNARDAMIDGGEFFVRASNETIEGGRDIALKPGKYVKMSFKDSGVGIAAENITKIFDPYFSTKSKGSGLGLTSAYSIVRKHGGIITVESMPRIGSVFTVYIPVSLRFGTENSGVKIGCADSRKYKILVMDDESIVREVTSNLLKHLGYEAFQAKNGTEAIEMYLRERELGKPFDALILDLMVPGDIGGPETLKKLRQVDPEVKAIVASGFSNEMIMSRYSSYGFAGLISKPYMIKELDELLQKIIMG